MSKAIIDVSKLDQLTSVGVTGHDLGRRNVYPMVVNVLQSDKQYEAFADGDDISKKDYGKLFIRGTSNVREDLVDSVEGTIIKIEQGYEIRNDEGIVESGIGFLSPAQKDVVNAEGNKPVNMVKILIAIGKSEEVNKALVDYNSKVQSGGVVTKDEFPFAVIVVKGASFGSWFDVQGKMEEIATSHFGKQLAALPVTSFRIVVKSKKETSEKFGDFYAMEFDIKPEDIDEAIAMSEHMVAMADKSLYFKVKERIEEDSNMELLRESVKEMEPVEGEIEDLDLPF